MAHCARHKSLKTEMQPFHQGGMYYSNFSIPASSTTPPPTTSLGNKHILPWKGSFSGVQVQLPVRSHCHAHPAPGNGKDLVAAVDCEIAHVHFNFYTYQAISHFTIHLPTGLPDSPCPSLREALPLFDTSPNIPRKTHVWRCNISACHSWKQSVTQAGNNW